MAEDFDIRDFTLTTASKIKAKEVTDPLDSVAKHFPGHIFYDEAGAEVIGKVTASPTANTLLARLKDLLTGIVLAAGTNVIGKVSIDQTTAGTTNKVYLTNFNKGDYETVAASQTDQALGATGGSGDFLSHVLIIPATTSPGAVSIKDGSGSAITIFTGGASSVSNLVPFSVPHGAKSGSGAWKVTTGANVSAIGFGDFT